MNIKYEHNPKNFLNTVKIQNSLKFPEYKIRCFPLNHHLSDEDDESPSEAAPKLVEAMNMIRRLQILATTEQPQLDHLIARLGSQRTELYINSKGVSQTGKD